MSNQKKEIKEQNPSNLQKHLIIQKLSDQITTQNQAFSEQKSTFTLKNNRR